MKIIIYISFFFISLVSLGQFTGGAGDGYSGLDVSTSITSIENSNSDLIYTLKSNFSKGELVTLSGINKVDIIDLKGRLVFTIDSQEFRIPENLQIGIYIFILHKVDNILRQRIYVQE